MKKVYFTPGPTELYSEVPKYLEEAIGNNICSISHRSSEFMEIYKQVSSSLKQLLGIPNSFRIFFLASATESMDRIIQNTVAENCFHFVNGAFAERFYKTALELGKRAGKCEATSGSGFDFENVTIAHTPELICFTQNETSTGVALPVEEIYGFGKKFPEAIIAVDIVTASPYLKIDFTKIDCAFFSVQKGFGLPAGLGVLIVNERCIEKAKSLKEKNIRIGSYHNFLSLDENAVKFQTSETPNVLTIYLLGRVCEMLNNYGIEKIRSETEEKSGMLYEFFDSHSKFGTFVKQKKDRSKTIVVADVGESLTAIKKSLREEGFVIGSGYGKFKDTQVRIANFPMHKIDDVKKIISALDKL